MKFYHNFLKNLAKMCSTTLINENSLPEWESALDRAEETMRRISGQCRLQKTGHPDVCCSTLPTHWRSNKSLPTPFVVLAFFPVQDGTRVCISAGNDENFCADVKNNMAEFNGQLARFSDLRFVGKSGRGKNFNLSITIFTQPHSQLIIVPNVVKVTVDGPRDSRNASKYLNGQYIPIPKRIRPSSGLEQATNHNGSGRKNASEHRRWATNSAKIHHPIAGIPNPSFLLSHQNPPSSANVFPPFLPPHGLPMAAALGGLFPRLMNGKIGINLPANIHQTRMNVRQPFLGIGSFGHGLRMPTMMANQTDSIMAQIASGRLFGQNVGGLLPPHNNNPTFPQIGQSTRLSLFTPNAGPLFNENLQAAISAAVAASNGPPPSSSASSIFPSTMPSNPAVNILAVQAMAGLFANASVIPDKFGTQNGICQREGGDGREERNEEEKLDLTKANCEPTGSSPDEGHCSEESREEEEVVDNGTPNCIPRSRNRKRSRTELGIDNADEEEQQRRKHAKHDETARLLNANDEGNKTAGMMPWLALKKQPNEEGEREEGADDRPSNPIAHSAVAALWRPFC